MADVWDSREQPVLELKKKQLLEELESALAPKDGTVTAPPNLIRPSSLAFGIEVIDETALLDSVANNGGFKQQSTSRRRGSKNNNHKRSEDTTMGRPELKPNPKPNSGIHKYSRKDLESLRFLNMAQQRKFWKAIHAALGTDVANEYDALASTHNHHPLPHNKPILSVAATNGRWRYMNVFVH